MPATGGKCTCLSHEAKLHTNDLQVRAFLAGEKVTSIAAGADHSLALTAHGEVFSWGENGHGQLGHSKAPGLGFFRLARPEWKPRLLRGLETQKVTQVWGA